MGRLWIIVVFIVLFIQCDRKNDSERKQTKNKYARGFEVESSGTIKKITVFNPWEKANNISFEYYLLKKGQKIPDSLKRKKVIIAPVERVVCLSTSHIAFLDALNETNRIVGISGSQYINNQKIRERIKSGEVVDVGYDDGLNYELLLKQKPDLVFVYGIGSEVSATVMKMEDLGLKVFFISEYLEESPLGKAEWIKCIAPFFEKENEAELFFQGIEKDYNSLKDSVLRVTEKPDVLVGMTFRDSWWVPGGKSYLANLIEDAGGNYIGKNNRSDESYVLSFENALKWSETTDIWINVGSVYSKAEILASDERFKKVPSFNNARIFNNNGRMSPEGGNDFWESGTVYPNRILGDLIRIFHPGLLEGNGLEYYREVK
jgi:iron complex transport system substrate-binding protein